MKKCVRNCWSARKKVRLQNRPPPSRGSDRDCQTHHVIEPTLQFTLMPWHRCSPLGYIAQSSAENGFEVVVWCGGMWVVLTELRKADRLTKFKLNSWTWSSRTDNLALAVTLLFLFPTVGPVVWIDNRSLIKDREQCVVPSPLQPPENHSVGCLEQRTGTQLEIITSH